MAVAQKPLAVLYPRDLQPGPRMPTSDEQLLRLLVRNVFCEDREDRMVPQIMDRLVGLVWFQGRYVPAVIEHPRYTPLNEMERLHRDVPWVLFKGEKEDLAPNMAPARSVRGREVEPQLQSGERVVDWLYRHRHWRNRNLL